MKILFTLIPAILLTLTSFPSLLFGLPGKTELSKDSTCPFASSNHSMCPFKKEQAISIINASYAKLAVIPSPSEIENILKLKSPETVVIFRQLQKTAQQLGEAMVFGYHHELLDNLNQKLSRNTLVQLVEATRDNPALTSVFSVFFTGFEQAYHWPRDLVRKTPPQIEDHKLVIQALFHPQLQKMIAGNALNPSTPFFKTEQWIEETLDFANKIIESGFDHRIANTEFSGQEIVNLFYRTSQQDYVYQGDYNDPNRPLEFGELYEILHTSGTQRRLQNLFEESGAIEAIHKIQTSLKEQSNEEELLHSLGILQASISLVRDELFNMLVDEVIWGRTFAVFSKAVGASTVGASGVDTPLFHMLDALLRFNGETSASFLLNDLTARSKRLPDSMREFITQIQAPEMPSLRNITIESKLSPRVKWAYFALQQQYFNLLEMHRKKAMRIVLALRAGQSNTSSGGGSVADPATHINNALQEAMDMRFGKTPKDFRIPGKVRAYALVDGDDSCHQGARVTVDLSTPLALLPGDRLDVTAEWEPGTFGTRTYSVAHIVRDPSTHSIPALQLASQVELSVRNFHHRVSAKLCNSFKVPLNVEVFINSAPHFRLTPNSQANEHTFLIAQGTAVGMYATWLNDLAQDKAPIPQTLDLTGIIGRYTLLVGSRDLSSLPYLKELRNLVGQNGLHIVLALSRPKPGDLKTAEGYGFEVIKGRVTQYIVNHPEVAENKGYVCGSSNFGLTIAAKLNKKEMESDKRAGQINERRVPKFKYDLFGNSGVDERDFENNTLQNITVQELSKHNKPNDIWIVHGNLVYDVSDIMPMHPGGQKMIIRMAGRLANNDKLFDIVHGNSHEVSSMMKERVIGQLDLENTALAKQTPWGQRLEQILDIQNDLTNGSRFEVWPGRSGHRLTEFPPIQIFDSTLEHFISSYAHLARESIQDTTLQMRLEEQVTRATLLLKKLAKVTKKSNTKLLKTHISEEIKIESLKLEFTKRQKIILFIHSKLDHLKGRVGDLINNTGHLLPTEQDFVVAISEINSFIEDLI